MENVFLVNQDGMTAVLVQDLEDNGYTSFYKEDSRSVGEGQTKEDALKSLREGYKVLKEWDEEL